MDKQPIIAPSVYEPANGTHAVGFGGALYTAAVLPLDKHGKLVGAGDVVAQSAQVFTNLDLILGASHVRWSDVFKVNIYLSPHENPAQLERACSVRHRYLAPGQQVGLVASMELADAEILIAIELFAHTGARKQVLTGVLGSATAPGWADAVTVEDRVFASGQLPIFAQAVQKAHELPAPFIVKDTLKVQAARVYENLDAILKWARVDWSNVCKVRQYITRPRIDFGDIRAARSRYLSLGKFMSTSVGCHQTNPEWQIKDWLIEVELEAALGEKTYLSIPGVPQNPDGPQPHIIKVGKAIHVHGMVPWAADLSTLHDGNIHGQAEVVYGHLDDILKGAGLSWLNVVHARTYCVDRNHFPATRQVQQKWLGNVRCANSEFVATTYAHDWKALLEVDIMAVPF